MGQLGMEMNDSKDEVDAIDGNERALVIWDATAHQARRTTFLRNIHSHDLLRWPHRVALGSSIQHLRLCDLNIAVPHVPETCNPPVSTEITSSLTCKLGESASEGTKEGTVVPTETGGEEDRLASVMVAVDPFIILGPNVRFRASPISLNRVRLGIPLSAPRLTGSRNPGKASAARSRAVKALIPLSQSPSVNRLPTAVEGMTMEESGGHGGVRDAVETGGVVVRTDSSPSTLASTSTSTVPLVTRAGGPGGGASWGVAGMAGIAALACVFVVMRWFSRRGIRDGVDEEAKVPEEAASVASGASVASVVSVDMNEDGEGADERDREEEEVLDPASGVVEMDKITTCECGMHVETFAA